MEKIIILAPNREFNGTRNRVPFLHGKAVVPVDYGELGWFARKGYTIILPESGIYNEDEAPEELPFEETEDEEDLEQYTVAQLTQMAKEREIDLGKARRKADIIAILLG